MAEERPPQKPIEGGLRSTEPDVRCVMSFVSRVCVYKRDGQWWLELYSERHRYYLLPVDGTQPGEFRLSWLTDELRQAAFVSETLKGEWVVFYRKLMLRYRNGPKLETTMAHVGGDLWKLTCELCDDAVRRLNEVAEPMGLYYSGPGWAADHVTRTPPCILRKDCLLEGSGR